MVLPSCIKLVLIFSLQYYLRLHAKLSYSYKQHKIGILYTSLKHFYYVFSCLDSAVAKGDTMREEELPLKFKDCTALQRACCCTLPSHLPFS